MGFNSGFKGLKLTYISNMFYRVFYKLRIGTKKLSAETG